MATAPTDLTTVAAVKQLLLIPSGTTTSDDDIQSIITAAGLSWLEQTGRDTLNQSLDLVEYIDGNGGTRIYPRNYPIISVTSLLVNGQTLTPSPPPYNTPGYIIDGQNSGLLVPISKSISIVGPNALTSGTYQYFNGPIWRFNRGHQNVQLTYAAGPATLPSDLEYAQRRLCAMQFRREQTQETASLVLAGGGTTRYRDWEMEPQVARVLREYTRVTLNQ
jgi:hypothetical protein